MRQLKKILDNLRTRGHQGVHLLGHQGTPWGRRFGEAAVEISISSPRISSSNTQSSSPGQQGDELVWLCHLQHVGPFPTRKLAFQNSELANLFIFCGFKMVSVDNLHLGLDPLWYLPNSWQKKKTKQKLPTKPLKYSLHDSS